MIYKINSQDLYYHTKQNKPFLGRFLIALDILFLMLLYYKNNTTNQDNIDFKY